ncbi:MAG: alpha/beta hydrolase [Acidobacteriia bacterium]|nr:alpha/beta hydrolase [Terriglobia bacterium]
MRNILLTGADDLLAAHVAAQYLSLTSDTVIYRAQTPEGDSSAQFTARVAACLRGKETELLLQGNTRLHVVAAGVDYERMGLPDSTQPAEVWHFIPTHRRWKQHSSAALAGVLAALPALGAHQFNLVVAASAGHSGWSSQDAIRECQARGVACRLFRTALVLAESDPFRRDHDLLWFLGVLNDLRHEIQERAAEYFDFETLKICIPSGAEINLLHGAHAAGLMVRLALQESTANHAFDIAAPENMQVEDFLQRAASVYSLGLLATDDQDELNAIDLVFTERLGAFHAYLASGPKFEPEEAFLLAGLKPELTLFDKSSLLQVLKSLYSRQEAELAARDERVVALPAQLERHTIDRNGSELTYFSAGREGTPVLALNALGQGLIYWHRLVDILRHKHRVILWEPRGTVSPAQPFGINDQIDDILAILQREQISACHLAAWCTGPKLAVEFYVRHPDSILSIAMLNSQFKTRGTPRELVTTYENNIDPVFHALQNNPSIADYAMKSLQLSLADRKLNFFEQTDSKQLAVQVLSLINGNLKAHTLAPFQSEATTLSYARQVVDYWSFDSLGKAGQVKVPVLMITCEYDKIAAPAMSRLAVSRFPHASLIEVQGATHYCLYDRSEFIAGLIEEFFAATRSRVEEVAVVQ